jgi:hypothetical protein
VTSDDEQGDHNLGFGDEAMSKEDTTLKERK